MPEGAELKHLGKQSQQPVEEVECLPWPSRAPMEIQLSCDEFTSHCPVTDQPDFGRLQITYCPSDRIVETKSLKLFLYQFRDRRAFNEDLVREITEKLISQVKPLWIRVTGHFNRRGGICVQASLEWQAHADRLITVPDDVETMQ